MQKMSPWTKKIVLLMVASFIFGGCKVAGELAGSLGGNLTNFGDSQGVGSSLTSGGGSDDFGIEDDFSDTDTSEQYVALNKNFNKVEALENSQSKIPSSVAYSYFQILKSFRGNIQSGNVNNRDETGKTPLVAAIEKNDAAMVQFLVDQGANVDEQAIAAAQKTSNSFILQALRK
ncbi:ankyrin repeat domain-containing protein [Candidatus Uabimicrobium helgolandensis]